MTLQDQSVALSAWMSRRGMGQKDFSKWLDSKGITVSPQYLNDVLNGRRHPGPKFKLVFKEITGVTLVDGLVEQDY